MMRQIYITLMIVFLTAMGMAAEQYQARHDSVWVYNSWEAIMDQWPDTLIINPEITVWTPYDIEFEDVDKDVTKML